MTQPPYGQPDPRQWQGYGQQAPPPPPKRRRKWPWVVGGILLLFVVVGVANGPAPTASTSPPPAGVPSGVDPSTFNRQPPAVSGGVRVETYVVPAAPEPAQAGPLTSIGPGTYEVGTGDGQVAPGKYRSTGPDGSAGICYYSRLKNNDGSLGDIIANNVSQGPSILNVAKGDGYIEVNGCTFEKA